LPMVKAMLENALDVVRNSQRPNASRLIVPSRDVTV
jgi:hypothetical protein